MKDLLLRFKELLFKKVDAGSLAVFRIVFGAIMVWEVFRYFDKGWIARYWITPDHTFPFMFFEWLKPLPGDGMYYLFALIGLVSFFIMIGLFYRVSAVVFFFTFTYTFLLCKTRYLNHFYLVSLLGFLLMFLPAQKMFSVDSWLRRRFGAPSEDHADDRMVPYWTVFILQIQIGLVYFWGGIAKINKDWLIGNPMRQWLPPRSDFPVIGQFFNEEWMVYFFSYSGLAIDLFAFPMLMFRKTRPFAIITLVAFHLTNARLFTIGIFPWFMIGALAIYLAPDFPRRWFSWLAEAFGQKISRDGELPAKTPLQTALDTDRQFPFQRWAYGFFVAFLAYQMLMPIRHHFIPGDVSWTEDGHRFSWRMKLRTKKVKMKIWVKDKATGEKWRQDPYEFVNRRQWRTVKARPTMLLQFSQFIKDHYKEQQGKDVEVYVDSRANLNSRGYQTWVDPKVDLASQKPKLGPYEWIVPNKL